MNADRLFTGAVELLLLLLAISVRESARAWAAERCGDPTARSQGRVSLNPLRHLDLMGSLVLPILLIVFRAPVFGWGRPVPVLPQNLRDPRRSDLLIAVSGPFANGLLAAIATVAVGVAVHLLGADARRAAFWTLAQQTGEAVDLGGFPLMFTLVRLAMINAYLVVFNLIPLPPLDGGRIVLHLLPPDWAARFATMPPQYGFLISIVLAVSPLLTLLLLPFYAVLSVVIQLL
jgi:Zn-dependent protease